MMQDAWRDKWQPRNVFPSSRLATSVLGVSLAINPLKNRWPIKSRVQGEPSLINADCQGASLMYFSFKESVSNAHRFWVGCFFGFGEAGIFFLCLFFRSFAGAEWEELIWRDSANQRLSFLPLLWMRCLLALGSRESDGAAFVKCRRCKRVNRRWNEPNPVKLVVVLTMINTSRASRLRAWRCIGVSLRRDESHFHQLVNHLHIWHLTMQLQLLIKWLFLGRGVYWLNGF